jgi:hypothetical protein
MTASFPKRKDRMLDTLFARFFSAVLTVVVPAAQLWDALKKRLRRLSRDEVAVGPLGRPYFWAFKLPSYVIVSSLIVVVILAFTAFMGGLMVSAAGGDTKAYDSLHQSKWKIPVVLFEHALWILGAYLLVAVLFYFEVPYRLALFLTRSSRYKPGWISARRALRENGPVNIDSNACTAAANAIFQAMAQGSLTYEDDRASKPNDLETEELANCLLIGCTIESQLHDLKKSVKFAPLYATVASIGKQQTRPLSSKSINATDKNTFYAQLRSLQPNGSEVLPDDQSIHSAVNGVIHQLARSYKSSGSRLANSWVALRGPSLLRAEARLQAFAPFAGDGHKGMRELFLKLAVRWGIWPEAETGPFTFVFSRRISTLLLNLGCVTVPQDDKTLDIDEDMTRLVPEAEMEIVNRFKDFIRSGSDITINELCQSRFGCAPSSVPRWRISDEVDYFLWTQSRKEDGGCFGPKAVKPWYIADNSFVRGDS